MNMAKWRLVFFLIAFSVNGFSQEKYTISGYIKDSLSGETLIGANLGVKSGGKSISSNGYGFFSILKFSPNIPINSALVPTVQVLKYILVHCQYFTKNSNPQK